MPCRAPHPGVRPPRNVACAALTPCLVGAPAALRVTAQIDSVAQRVEAEGQQRREQLARVQRRRQRSLKGRGSAPSSPRTAPFRETSFSSTGAGRGGEMAAAQSLGAAEAAAVHERGRAPRSPVPKAEPAAAPDDAAWVRQTRKPQLSLPEAMHGGALRARNAADAAAAAAAMDEVAGPDNHFQRVVITGVHELSDEGRYVCNQLANVVALREKHVYKKPANYWGGIDREAFARSTERQRSAVTGVGRSDSGGAGGAGGPGETFSPTLHGTPTPAKGAASATPAAEVSVPSGAVTSTPAAEGRRISVDSGSTEEDMGGEGVSDDDLGDDDYVATMGARRENARQQFFKHKRVRPEPVFRPFEGPVPTGSDHTFKMVDGVVHIYGSRESDGKTVRLPEFKVPSFGEFYRDYREIVKVTHSAAVNSFAFRRLQLLEARFNLHCLLNADREVEQQKSVPHRDFYNVRKVDTHVHHSACMNQKHMLRFIKHKLKRCPDEVVIFRDGRFLTLAEVFESLSLTAFDLSIDTLDMHADNNTFHRFDRFNLKYNPCGQSRLREIFLKTDNLIGGKYLAEVTQEVFEDLEASKYQLAEYRVSIYGRTRAEWDKLSRWVYVHRLASANVRWLIQVPRLYEVYKTTGQVESFQDMLDNIFLPLFAVSVDPSSNPPLHYFLTLLVGFDCVDDESKHERGRDAEAMPVPSKWTSKHSPPYFYWIYYLHANIVALNKLRESKGMSTFSFRPHSGEAGEVDHMAASFLTAESINHGITMRRAPAMQYLYYLTQIGLAMSPLSNNKLFVDYHRNPFYTFFARGLNVSLSTDDPLLLHLTKEPLVEEYCVAAQVWKLSNTDKCEIARNSVLQSGFEHPYKAHYIGEHYDRPGVAGNDITLTNVPSIRLLFRHEILTSERALVSAGAKVGRPVTMSPLPMVRSSTHSSRLSQASDGTGARSSTSSPLSGRRRSSKTAADGFALEPPALGPDDPESRDADASADAEGAAGSAQKE